LTNYQKESESNELPQHGLNVGLIGLGTGTLAAYGQSGDQYRFYEINPNIIDLALGQGSYFTYLSDSPANIVIVPGDARITLEIERDSEEIGNFDILAVDAFSSDAIPVHLLTVEAVELYLEHLKPEGVLAIHISNRYLNLAPLVKSLAEYYQLDYAMIRNARDETSGSYASTWMLLSKNKAFFELPEIRENRIITEEDQPGIRIWTDDYSNLLPLIKMKEFTKIR
jgi:spermidine synthase